MFQTQVVRVEGLKDLTCYSLEPKSGFLKAQTFPRRAVVTMLMI